MAYEDVTLESNEEQNYRIGQIWKNHRKLPDSVFIIRKFIQRTYNDGNVALRVQGIVIHDDQEVEENYELDARSLHAMFRYILFDPPKPFVETPQ
jgi:hypothetical protein